MSGCIDKVVVSQTNRCLPDTGLGVNWAKIPNFSANFGKNSPGIFTSTLWRRSLPSLVSTVPDTGPYDGVALAAGVQHGARAQGGHLAVDRALWLATVRQVPSLECLDLAEPEVFIVHSVISDVDKLTQLACPVIAGELDLLLVESPLELSTGLVLRRVPVQDLNHEDGELLVSSGAHRDPDPVHHRVILQLNLKL